jgi:hypothetical protein
MTFRTTKLEQVNQKLRKYALQNDKTGTGVENMTFRTTKPEQAN